jgi:hypothetical protein
VSIEGSLQKYKKFFKQQQIARTLLVNTCFGEIVVLYGHFDHPQDQILPCFDGVFSQTTLEMRKPCTRDLVWRTGLFCGKVPVIAVRDIPSILSG